MTSNTNILLIDLECNLASEDITSSLKSLSILRSSACGMSSKQLTFSLSKTLKIMPPDPFVWSPRETSDEKVKATRTLPTETLSNTSGSSDKSSSALVYGDVETEHQTSTRRSSGIAPLVFHDPATKNSEGLRFQAVSVHTQTAHVDLYDENAKTLIQALAKELETTREREHILKGMNTALEDKSRYWEAAYDELLRERDLLEARASQQIQTDGASWLQATNGDDLLLRSNWAELQNRSSNTEHSQRTRWHRDVASEVSGLIAR